MRGRVAARGTDGERRGTAPGSHASEDTSDVVAAPRSLRPPGAPPTPLPARTNKHANLHVRLARQDNPTPSRTAIRLHESPHASVVCLYKQNPPQDIETSVPSAIFSNSVRMRSCTEVIVYKNKLIQHKQASISYMRQKYTCGTHTHLYVSPVCIIWPPCSYRLTRG